MSSCVFAGSFDPVTSGHMDVIARASAIFDKVIVTVMINVNKQCTFPVKNRISMLKKACGRFPNVEVDRWDGLLADYMRERGMKILIRGIRSCSEFEHEYASAVINRGLNDQFETLLIPSDPAFGAVSSSTVREVARFGGDLRGLVPDELVKDIGRILSKEI